MKKEIVTRLLSRKLWITICTTIVFILNKQYTEATIVVLGYLGVQGYSDVKTGTPVTLLNPETVVSQNVDDTARDTIITGNQLNK